MNFYPSHHISIFNRNTMTDIRHFDNDYLILIWNFDNRTRIEFIYNCFHGKTTINLYIARSLTLKWIQKVHNLGDCDNVASAIPFVGLASRTMDQLFLPQIKVECMCLSLVLFSWPSVTAKKYPKTAVKSVLSYMLHV